MPISNAPIQRTSLDASILLFERASIGLVPVCLITYSIAFSLLPAIWEPPSFENQPWPGVNRIGSSYLTLVILFAVFFLIIYSVKWLILEYSPKELALHWYAWLVVASLPFIWLALTVDWYYVTSRRPACWIGNPLRLWFIPTVTYVIDWRRGKNLTTWQYLARSAGEIIMIPTIWTVLWVILLIAIGWIGL